VSADLAKVAGVVISNPDKVWWPDEGITKADIARFYDGIWSHLALSLKDRPLTAERCPDGLAGTCFYQKDFPADKPPPGPRRVVRASSTGKDVPYVVGGLRPTLMGMVNLGCIAIHVMSTRATEMHQVDWLAFDLDPQTGEFADAARAGLALRKILDEVRLISYPKTSGGRGLHVFCPLRAGVTPQNAVAAAVALGGELARREPTLVTVEFSKAKRGARVFADAMRNAFGQTIVAPYSVRRRPGAPVSTPLAWDEVSPRLDPAAFNVRTFSKRMARDNPWSDFWRRRQALPKLLEA
jgi:bifunctional non-homologous end joining protein LigD